MNVTCPSCGEKIQLDPGAERVIDRAIVTRDRSGLYRVRAESSNGELILWSEQYADLGWAHRVAADLGVPVTEQQTA